MAMLTISKGKNFLKLEIRVSKNVKTAIFGQLELSEIDSLELLSRRKIHNFPNCALRTLSQYGNSRILLSF